MDRGIVAADTTTSASSCRETGVPRRAARAVASSAPAAPSSVPSADSRCSRGRAGPAAPTWMRGRSSAPSVGQHEADGPPRPAPQRRRGPSRVRRVGQGGARWDSNRSGAAGEGRPRPSTPVQRASEDKRPCWRPAPPDTLLEGGWTFSPSQRSVRGGELRCFNEHEPGAAYAWVGEQRAGARDTTRHSRSNAESH